MDWDHIQPGDNNFWFRDNGATITVVYVHGIFSDSRSAWHTTGKSDGAFWPEILDQDSRIDTVNVFLSGFYTDTDSSELDIDQCAKAVLSSLRLRDTIHHRIPLESPVIIFVCHSFGGIVIRHLLVSNQQLVQDKVVGLALMASPSLGSKHANKAGNISKLYGNKIGRALWAEDLPGYRKNLKTLPGKPDVVYTKHKLAIFLHGCFWHGCRHCRRNLKPTVNAEFWKNKLRLNIKRDARSQEALLERGYRVLVFWECQVKSNLESVIQIIRASLTTSRTDKRATRIVE